MSRSALERLGKRLVQGPTPDDADLAELQQLLAAYDPVLAETVEVVAATIGQNPSSRTKNTATILEKPRRNGGHKLGTIYDLGGLRVVIDGDRSEQDRVVNELVAAFSDASRPPRVIDRRAEPVHGYRAVHIIVYPDGFPIEIQVRTLFQHQWAEWFERFADTYGRGIRYGKPPSQGGDAAQDTVNWMLQVADQIAESEETGGTAPLGAVALVLFDAVMTWLRNQSRPPDA